jgi:tetratricopeptide (TPR) repeat protein
VIASRGETYRLMKRYEDAIQDFDRAITLNEKYSWAIANRGETYRSMKRYEDAIQDFDRAIILDEKNDWHWYNRALVYLLAGKEDAFHQDIRNAVAVVEQSLHEKHDYDTDYYRRQFNYAFYLLINGEIECSTSEYSKTLVECSFTAQLDDAINDLKEFLTIQPLNSIAHQVLQQLEASLHDKSKQV